MRVLVRENQASPLTAVTIAFYGGCRQEAANLAGITCLTQKVMLKSTGRRSAAEVAEQLEYLGAAIAPFCYHDVFGVTVSLLSRNLPGGLALISECIQDAGLTQSEIERERRNLLFELARRDDDPLVQAFDRSENLLFGAHSYGRNTHGNAHSLKEIGRGQVTDWYLCQVRPDRAVVAVVGDLRSAFVVEAVEGAFRAFQARARLCPHGASLEPMTQRREEVALRGRHQAVVVMGFRGPSFLDPDLVVFELLNAVLAGTGGRLFTEIRERRGLAYAIRSTVTRRRDCSILRVHLATRPEQVDQARQAVQDELERLRYEAVLGAELHRAKKYVLGLFELSLQRKSVEAYQRAFHELLGSGQQSFDGYPQRVREVDGDRLLQVARQYLEFERSVCVQLRPR